MSIRVTDVFQSYLEEYSKHEILSERERYVRRRRTYFTVEGGATSEPAELMHLAEASGLDIDFPRDWQHAFRPEAVFDARGSWRKWGAD